MTKDQAQKVLDTKVQAANALLASIRDLAVANGLSIFIPATDVDSGRDYCSVKTETWASSSYDEDWASSSYNC